MKMDDKPNKIDTLRAEAEARVEQIPLNLVNPQPGEEILHRLLQTLIMTAISI